MIRMICTRCGTALAPAWSGFRCPRFSACGRGGIVESSALATRLHHAMAGTSHAET